jgi:hypothetical protein
MWSDQAHHTEVIVGHRSGSQRLRAPQESGPVEEPARRHTGDAPVRVANRSLAGALQPKLEVGPAGDRYEQEADRVARTVVGATAASVRRHGDEDVQMSRLQRQGPEDEELQMKRIQRGSEGGELEEEELQMSRIQRQGPEEEELQMSRLQRSVAPVVGAAGGELDGATEAAIARAGSGGRPLEAGMQRDMESSFGADFSSVRVHTGPKTDALNSAMQSRAFTTGSDVFVRSSDYNPESRGGRELLAHELTHVVQQGAAPTLTDESATR